jgi:hypothetical protein
MYYEGDKANVDKMGATCNPHGEDDKCIKILVGTHERKIQLGKPSRRWEDNIKMLLNEIGSESLA